MTGAATVRDSTHGAPYLFERLEADCGTRRLRLIKTTALEPLEESDKAEINRPPGDDAGWELIIRGSHGEQAFAALCNRGRRPRAVSTP